MTRSDTPYADLYETSQELSAMAQAAAYWAIGIMWQRKCDGIPLDDVVPVLRTAMKVRRVQRATRAKILAESFKREVCGGDSW